MSLGMPQRGVSSSTTTRQCVLHIRWTARTTGHVFTDNNYFRVPLPFLEESLVDRLPVRNLSIRHDC